MQYKRRGSRKKERRERERGRGYTVLTVFLGVGGQDGGPLVASRGRGLQTAVKVGTLVAPVVITQQQQ